MKTLFRHPSRKKTIKNFCAKLLFAPKTLVEKMATTPSPLHFVSVNSILWQPIEPRNAHPAATRWVE